MKRLILILWLSVGWGQAWAQGDKFQQKLLMLDSLEALYAQKADYHSLADVKEKKAIFLIEDKKYGVNAASLRLLLESANLFGRSGDSTKHYILKNQLNYYYSLSEKPDPILLENLQKSIVFFDKTHNNIQLIWAHELILTYLLSQRDYPAASTYKDRLIKLASRLSDMQQEHLASKAGISFHLATYYLEKFQHERPEKKYLDSAQIHVLQIAKYLPNLPRVYWLVGINDYYLGLIAEFRKTYDQALAYYFKAEPHFVDNDSKLGLNFHIQECYYQKGDFQKVHEYALQNRKLMEDLRKGYFGYLGEYSKTWEVLQNTELENLLIKEQEKTTKARAERFEQWVVLGILVLIVAVAMVFQWQYNRYQRAAFRLQLELSQQRRDSANKILAVQEQERQHMALELHDSLGGMLSISKLTAENIQAKLQHPKLDTLIEQLQNTQSELYKIINHFQPSISSLSEALSEWLAQMERFHPLLSITFNHAGQEHGLPVVHQQLFRIAQELVHNTIKHAQANTLLIELNYFESSIILLIKDDGVGFDSNKIGHGWGLQNVQMRLNMLGGHIEYHPASPSGTEVLIHIQLDSK